MLPHEDPCPVHDSLLGDLYRASPIELRNLLENIPTQRRAELALYCQGRAHLAGLAEAVAATCDLVDLVAAGGMAGRVLFTKSRTAPIAATVKRSKITLSTGGISHVIA